MILQDGKLVASNKDKLVAQAAGMVTWVIMALNLYLGVVNGQAGRCITSIGMLSAMSAAVLIGPAFRIVDAKEGSVPAKILSAMLVFGLMITATGLLIQFASAIR